MSDILDLQKLQQKTFQILLQVDQICRKYNIKYYLVYGTALGAIRHKGFIPWDDDIDIAMFREDFEKFKLVSRKMGEEYFLQTKETDYEYPMELPKIRLNNTAFVEAGLEKFNMHHGIFIDIFILEYSLKNKTLDKLTQLVYRLDIYNSRKHTPTAKSSRVIFALLKPLLYKGKFKKWWIENIYKKSKKDYNSCNDIVSYGYTFDSADFGEPRYVEFEKWLFPVPGNVENHLSQCYGDYMKLPPVSKRAPHHKIVYFSLNNSYNFDKDKVNK